MSEQLSEAEIREVVKLFIKLYPPEKIIKIIIEEWETDEWTRKGKIGNVITWFFQKYR